MESGRSQLHALRDGRVPVGIYDPTRLATMGLGHWATDAGAGYTYLNEQVGFEWSAVVGFTYNFIKPYTQYRSGIDAHWIG
jgi:hypothetical protein